MRERERADTDLRPDIVCWNDDKKTITIVELTVCFETSYKAAVTRKEDRYLDLILDAKRAGYSPTQITLEMGSRGLPNMDGFQKLRDTYPQATNPSLQQSPPERITTSSPWITQHLVFKEQHQQPQLNVSYMLCVRVSICMYHYPTCVVRAQAIIGSHCW